MSKNHKPKQIFDVGRTLPKPQPKTVSRSSELATAPTTKTPRKRSWKRRLVLVLMVPLVLTLIIGVWDAINLSRASSKTFGSGNVLRVLSPTTLSGAERGRVNILLVGYSVDDPGHPGASLTDSIMLLSLSTTERSGYMLSVPRDLYVEIPDYGYGKINQVYNEGGMELLKNIVSEKFDTPIDYYVLINYAAVRDTVTALGGITVKIESPDPDGLYDPNISPVDGGPLKLSNGSQKLDGQTALNLTRARGDAYGAYGFPQADFDRTRHQRQVVTAIKDELDWKLILNPLQNGRIFNAIGSNVKTDLTLGEVRPLFGLFNRIPSPALKSVSLRDIDGQNLLASYSSSNAGLTLIPADGIDDYSQIQAVIDKLDE